MRRRTLPALFLGLTTFAAAASGAELRFEAPVFDRPHYAIRLAFDIKNRPAAVSDIRLNGAIFGSALIFRDGKLVDKSKPLNPGTYEIVLDYAWASGKKYTVSLARQEKNQSKAEISKFTGLSAATGGIPSGCDEGFSRAYRVSEEAGLERVGETCYLTLTALKTEVEEPAFRMFDGDEEIPYQVLARDTSGSGPEAGAANPKTVTYKLAFPLHSAPYQKKLLVVFKGGNAKSPLQDLRLSGEYLGKTLRTPHFVLQFHPQSGQILMIESVREGIKLWNKAGVIHWNPDVFIPGIAWDHSFDWNPPQAFEEKIGGLVYLNSRRGPLPRIHDVTLEVRYTVDSGHPYFLSETRLSVEKDLAVIAVRNDEMVLFKELFDALMYRDKDGRVITLPLREKPEAPFGLVHIAPPDIPWVGLVSTKDGYGFFSLRLEAAAASLGPAGDFSHKAGTYFYAPSDGDYVYWVRPLLYTWGDYATNNLLTFVPKGSFFYEKNAYLLLRLNEGTPKEIDALLTKLRNPLRIF